MLDDVVAKEPEYFVLGRTLLCSQPLAALRQRIWSNQNPDLMLGEIVAWVFPRDLLVSKLGERGYRLTGFSEGPPVPHYFAETIPPAYRDARECAMLFERARRESAAAAPGSLTGRGDDPKHGR
ncbi:MAG: hypothetical protein K9G59_18545 [Caulobacter sp.]|nr:hypothetical protein [Caulobacter sp.]